MACHGCLEIWTVGSWGATAALNPGEWMEDPLAAQEATRMDEFSRTDERRLGPSGQACPSLFDSYSCLG